MHQQAPHGELGTVVVHESVLIIIAQRLLCPWHHSQEAAKASSLAVLTIHNAKSSTVNTVILKHACYIYV